MDVRAINGRTVRVNKIDVMKQAESSGKLEPTGHRWEIHVLGLNDWIHLLRMDDNESAKYPDHESVFLALQEVVTAPHVQL